MSTIMLFSAHRPFKLKIIYSQLCLGTLQIFLAVQMFKSFVLIFLTQYKYLNYHFPIFNIVRAWLFVLR